MTAPVEKDTETVYSEVRTSRQGTMSIQSLILCEKNQVKQQETGETPTVNIGIVRERIYY